MSPGRYRCHAALSRDGIISPALVTIHQDGQPSVSPCTGEPHSTIDFNGVVVMTPSGHQTKLPSTIPASEIAGFLNSLDIPSSDESSLTPYFIPLGI